MLGPRWWPAPDPPGSPSARLGCRGLMGQEAGATPRGRLDKDSVGTPGPLPLDLPPGVG